jgi:hypothetical protein
MQKEQVACIHIRKGRIAKMEFKRRPHDLQNQKCSL